MIVSKSIKTGLIAATLAVCGFAHSGPVGGLYNVWVGHADFQNHGSIGVSAATSGECSSDLGAAIAQRQANGWTLTANRGCKLANYKSFTIMRHHDLELEYAINDYKAKLEKIQLSHQIQMDAEIAELEQQYNIEAFRARVAEESQ